MKNLALQPVLVGGLLLADAFELVLLPLRVQVYIAQEFDCVAEIESQDVLEMFPGLLELAEHLRIRWATIDLVVGLLDLQFQVVLTGEAVRQHNELLCRG